MKGNALGEQYIAILRLLLEYRYLTARDLWQVLAPEHQDSTATSHKLARMVGWGLIRGERLQAGLSGVGSTGRTAERSRGRKGGGGSGAEGAGGVVGGSAPLVYSLLRAGADVLRVQLGSHYYRRPSTEQVQYQSLRLQVESQLERAGYRYLCSVPYNSIHPRPPITPQSRYLIASITTLETQSIDAELRLLKARWWRGRWAPAVDPSFERELTLDSIAREDAEMRDWLQTQRDDRRLLEAHQERLWATGGVYEWLRRHGILSPWGVPERILDCIMALHRGSVYSAIPRQLNDYVAYNTVTPHHPLILVLCRASIQRQQLRDLLDLYKPVSSCFPCLLVMGDATAGERLTLAAAQSQVQDAACICIAASGLDRYLTQHQSTVAVEARL
jgi:hypothetical protein